MPAITQIFIANPLDVVLLTPGEIVLQYRVHPLNLRLSTLKKIFYKQP